MGGGSVGGLVAATTNVSGALPAEVEDSYWDTDMSELDTSVGGIGKTTVELQTPIDAMGIYQNWSSADWDFGNTTSYPALRYTTSTSVDACDSDSDTALPDCGVLLPGQPGRDSGLSALFFVVDDIELNNEVFGDQPFSSLISDYDVEIPFQFRYTNVIELKPYTVNKSATVSIVIEGDDTERDYFERRSSGNLSEEITLSSENTTLTVVVTDDNSMTTRYNFRTRRLSLSSIRISITYPDGRGAREGGGMSLTAETTADSIDLSEFQYRWQQEDLRINTETSSTRKLRAHIPANFVPSDADNKRIVFKLIVTDGIAVSSTTEAVNIVRVNNGNPSFTPTVTASEISIAISDPDDGPDGNGSARYIWERFGAGDTWVKFIPEPPDEPNKYNVPLQNRNNTIYRVTVFYIDAQDYEFEKIIFIPYRFGTDIDNDDDGLIDIYFLEELYNIDHQLDGSGYKESADASKDTTGCPDGICKGYELRRDLDFAATQSYLNVENKAAWTTGAGWDPIGYVKNNQKCSNSFCFSGIFEGNGKRISNLLVNRRDMPYVGLFAGINNGGSIRNIGLSGLQVIGSARTGGLVGRNEGRIVNSYVRGNVSGGLFTGGLIGSSELGHLINSYADVSVKGSSQVGGLIGSVVSSEISNSYAAGSIPSNSTERGRLVGWTSNATVKNSYSITKGAGFGLIGNKFSATVVSNSYWETGQTSSGEAKTTNELQSPTTLMGIYANWSYANWDFGDAKSYPALRYSDGGVNACAMDSQTALPRCGALLPGQSGRDSGLSALFFAVNNVDLSNIAIFGGQSFSSLRYNYNVTLQNTKFKLKPYAIAGDASISIKQAGNNTDYFADKSSGDTSEEITLETDGTSMTLELVVTDTRPTTYTFTVRQGDPPPTIRINGDKIINANEGDEITLTTGGRDIGEVLYSWQQEDLGINTGMRSTSTLTVDIPEDFVAREKSIQDVVFTLVATNGVWVTHTTKTVAIRKQNNGNPSFTSTVTASRISIAISDPDDGPDGNGSATYIWEQRDMSDAPWTQSLNSRNTNVFISPGADRGDTRYRVQVTYTDAQGNPSFNDTLGPFRTDIDDDNDGLIDIYYLEDLHNVRYQTDGSGYTTKVLLRTTAGCLFVATDDICKGYELRRDLDFATTQSYINAAINKAAWTTGAGWDPIGSIGSIFEGNGNRISNLRINRDSGGYIGLFRENSNSGSIRNIELVNPQIEVNFLGRVGALLGYNLKNVINSNVIGGSVKVQGAGDIGGLIGRNSLAAIIINSYARDITVEGSSSVGGLCGLNYGRIINSYAHATVKGIGQGIGGLVGVNQGSGSRIINSYAAGSVSSTQPGVAQIGGLLGERRGGSAVVTNSYSIARVDGSNGRGLIGGWGSRNVNDSYWDTDASDQATSAGGGAGKTTVELQELTRATDIYENWSSRDWDFGDMESYPALRYNEFDDVDACDMDPQTVLPICGTLLPDQSGRDSGLNALFFRVNNIDLNNVAIFGSQPFSSLLFNYTVTIPYTTKLQLRPYAINNSADISIVIAGVEVGDFADKPSGDLSEVISLPRENVPTTVTVIVTDTKPTTYHFVVSRIVPEESIKLEITNPAPDSHVNEGTAITATVSDSNGLYYYLFKRDSVEIAQGLDTTTSLSFNISEDLSFAGNATTQRFVFTLLVNNGGGAVSQNIELIVVKTDNGDPQLELGISTTTLSINHLADDPDGVGTFSYQWQQWGVSDTQWDDISTSTRYMVPDNADNADSIIRYRVQVSHRDGQGFPPKTWTTDPFPADIDVDDDGLIDIYYLEDLDVVRHQLDGSGYRISSVPTAVTAGKITSGCLAVGGLATCAGYELLRDLDFATTQSYINVENKAAWTVADFGADDGNDSGWLPIGDETASFDSLFNGKNYKISNLQINRDITTDSKIALFGVISKNAEIRNIGILDVRIEGKGDTGSLVAENRGAVINSYVGGDVSGTQHRLGGLVAINGDDDNDVVRGVIVNSYANVAISSIDVLSAGGLVGSNKGTIRNSYVVGNVVGPCDVGGLVGENKSSASGRSQIINSYAVVGTVSRLSDCTAAAARNRVSALVAYNEGLIRNSYARGLISGGDGSVGGLVAATTNVSVALVENSYWDRTNNDHITANDDGVGKRGEELRRPTTATGIYENWSLADWDFGEATQYPAIKYTSATDVLMNPACVDTSLEVLPQCGTVVPNQNIVSLPTVPEIDVMPEPLSNINADGSVDEGNTITLSVNVTGDSDYNYQWTATANDGAIASVGELGLPEASTASLTVTIPEDFIKSDTAANTNITFEVKVSDDSDVPVVRSKVLTIKKIDNGPPQIELEESISRLSIDIKAPDPDGVGEVEYKWEKRGVDSAAWVKVSTASTYVLPTDAGSGGNRYRVSVTHTDGQGYETLFSRGPFDDSPTEIAIRTDIDDDNDGKVDIYYLEDLDAIRYQLDGSGYRDSDAADKIVTGCPTVKGVVQCSGYELRRYLDFATTQSYINAANKENWTTGKGWQPIGDSSDPFSSEFAANNTNLTISNLMINRPEEAWVGLFGVLTGKIEDVHLMSASVKGYSVVGALVGSIIQSDEVSGEVANSSVAGDVAGISTWIGGLAGTNYGSIVNSYAQADVSGQGTVGGLTGYNFGTITHSSAFGDVEGRSFSGGLVGYNQGPIRNSHANGLVQSAFYGGGLVGYNDSYVGDNKGGVMNNVYAIGDVIGGTYIGGLAGYNDSVINNAYAIGSVIGSGGLGGLVGINDDEGEVNRSYWDIEAVGVSDSAGGTSATSTVLRMSTATESIYVGWSEMDWSFGSAETPKYPTLKYSAGSEGDIPACGSESLPACGSDLPTAEQPGIELSQENNPLVLKGLQLSAGTLEPPFDPTKSNYELLDVSGGQTTVTATANNASVKISVDTQEASMSTQASLSVQLEDLAAHDIVIELTAAGRSAASYTIAYSASAQPNLSGSEPCSATDIDKDNDGLIEICDIEGLYAMRYQMDGSGYRASASATKITAGCAESDCKGYELNKDLDFSDSSHYRDKENQMIWTVDEDNYADNKDKGWRPIGDFANPFNAVFDANGYTISNLGINRDDSKDGRDHAGLFGHIGENAELNGIGLSAAEVRGRFVVGALVGSSGLIGLTRGGAIVNSYVEGEVSGSQKDGTVDSNWIGGIVGSNNGSVINSYARADVSGHTTIGGLAGSTGKAGKITNSYAVGAVSGINFVGGLVGFNQGKISNCYAEGTMRGNYAVAGLVGSNDDEGTITNCYAAGMSSGSIAGLVNLNLGTIEKSYWQSSDLITSSAGGMGLTAEALQSSEIFSGWDAADWDFGNAMQYPTIKYTTATDVLMNPACEIPPPDTALPNCGELLSEQRLKLERIELVGAELFPSFDLAVRNYAASVLDDTTDIDVIATANSTATKITVNDIVVSSDKRSKRSTVALAGENADTKFTVVAVANEDQITTYTIVIVKQAEVASFVPSRFAGQPSNLECRNCNPNADGVVRMRFAPESVVLSGNNIQFKMQFRRILGGAGRYISSADFGLKYSSAAFGENLNTPVPGPYVMNSSQCAYERSAFFNDGNKYGIRFSDTSVDELHIAERSMEKNADADQLNALGMDWADVLTMTCTIANPSNEAGLAIAGSDLSQVGLRRYDNDGDAIPSPALLLADNDLRGLRLDGKTYVEDYVRYSDGRGVRLKFSKGVAVFPTPSGGTQATASALTTANFSLDTAADTMISTVTHIVGSAYVELEFNEVVERDVLRLASAASHKIYDVNEDFEQGVELADGNFVAALAYDNQAPVVESVTEVISTEVNGTTWDVTFNKPIHPDTVSMDALCLTNEAGVCPEEVMGSSITSVTLMEDDKKVLRVEIGSVEQAEKNAAIEFRNNEVLGANFRIVEGYQVGLRDTITIADATSPTITVDAGAVSIETQTNESITYSMSFTVSANEPITGLMEPGSYSLLRLNNDNDTKVPIEDAVPTVSSGNKANTVTVKYTGITVSVADIMESKGFTLGRASSTSLQDLSGKDPIGSSSGFLDESGVNDESAIAKPGALDATAFLASLGLSVESATSALIPMFDTMDQSYTIADVPNATTYTTVTAMAQNPAKISLIKSSSLEYNIEVNAVDSVQSDKIPLEEGGTTIITLVVTAQDGVTEQEYTVAINRLLSSEAGLKDLMITSESGKVSLQPDFVEGTLKYTAEVLGDVGLTINTTATHEQATIQITKTIITADTPEMRGRAENVEFELNPKTTTITLVVTAQNGVDNEKYTVVVTRTPSLDANLRSLQLSSGTLDSSFSPRDTEYTAEVYGDESIMITATAHPKATIQFAKTEISNDPQNLISGVESEPISLNKGTTTTIVIQVTPEANTDPKTYTIIVRHFDSLRVRAKVFLEGPLQ